MRLDQLLSGVRAGHGAALALRGEPGIGKTALLDYAAQYAPGYRVIRADGVDTEMELPFAGLQLVCASLLPSIGCMAPPQRDALGTAVGLNAGPEPNRFLVGLATLKLLSDAAEAQPLLCIVDDAQWLDRPSAQVLAFVARRLPGEQIAFLVAEREAQDRSEFHRLPALWLNGLPDAAARVLLDSAITGPLDGLVRERIIAETRGNPRALLDVPRDMSPADLAGGFGVVTTRPQEGRVEQSLLDQFERLPADSRRLVLAAAAEPTGDPTLLWRTAAELGISTEAVQPLESGGLLSLGPRVTFCNRLLRSAIYGAASESERRSAHRALAAATDPVSDPDRRAWHRANAADAPDDEVAEELERSAGRARNRSGLAAAGAFMETAAKFSMDPRRRAERALVAAGVEHEAGAPHTAMRLLATAEMGPPDPSRSWQVERLRGLLAFVARRGTEAPELLLRAAKGLEPLEPELSRATYLEALGAAIVAGRLSGAVSPAEVARAARAGPLAPGPPRAIDLLLDGLVVRFTEGCAAAAGSLKHALEAFRDSHRSDETIHWHWLACWVAADLWDDETWPGLATAGVCLARTAGALTVLPFAIANRATLEIHRGDFGAASALVNEGSAVAAAIGEPPLVCPSLALTAWRGRNDQALSLFEAARQDALARGEGITITAADYATALLCNGLGRYDQALVAARGVTNLDDLGLIGWNLVELIEAAVRSGDLEVAAIAFKRLSERTRLGGTQWGLGIEARSRALLTAGPAAEDLYVEAIERLQRSGIQVDLSRAQLLFGEWLRRQGRRLDARPPLRAALELFATMGAEAFAERARRELLATGEKINGRRENPPDELTPQEAQIAGMACDGLSNAEIATRLFVSRRTVEYHLHKVFGKLGIASRAELHLVRTDRIAEEYRESQGEASPLVRRNGGGSHELYEADVGQQSTQARC